MSVWTAVPTEFTPSAEPNRRWSTTKQSVWKVCSCCLDKRNLKARFNTLVTRRTTRLRLGSKLKSEILEAPRSGALTGLKRYDTGRASQVLKRPLISY